MSHCSPEGTWLPGGDSYNQVRTPYKVAQLPCPHSFPVPQAEETWPPIHPVCCCKVRCSSSWERAQSPLCTWPETIIPHCPSPPALPSG